MSATLRPLRALLVTTLAGALVLAACNTGSGAGGTPTGGTPTPVATRATSGGGGGYGGKGYGGGGGSEYATPGPTTASSPGTTSTAIAIAQSATLGAYLTGAGGKTLYTNTYTDTATTSGCNGACATTWPPLGGTASAGAGVSGAFASITRTDGTAQVTYAGHPLYYYSGDTAAGDTNGEGLDNNYWHVAKP